MEYSNSAAEAYRYHAPVAYDGVVGGGGFGQPFSSAPMNAGGGDFHVAASRRFHPYLSEASPSPGQLTPPVVLSGPAAAATAAAHADLIVTYQPASALHGMQMSHHQCDSCGAVYDSAHALAEHIETHHHFSAGAVFPDTYPSSGGGGVGGVINGAPVHNGGAPPPLGHIKGGAEAAAAAEAAEILDLDSHKVHVYQPPGMMPSAPAPAPTPPYTPAASSVGSSNSSMGGWMTPPLALPPPPQQQQQQHADFNRSNGSSVPPLYSNYQVMSPGVNGSSAAAPVATCASAAVVAAPPPPVKNEKKKKVT